MLDYEGSAAVLIVIAGEGPSEAACVSDKLLLTKRSLTLTHHSGEVAFPGGMWEPQDKNMFNTALREANEEVALRREDVTLLSQLKPSLTGRGVVVHPFVVRARSNLDYLSPDTREVSSIKWVNINRLLEDQRRRTDVFKAGAKEEFWAPVYEIDDYCIWGFTARVIVDYLNARYSAEIRRTHEAPERLVRL